MRKYESVLNGGYEPLVPVYHIVMPCRFQFPMEAHDTNVNIFQACTSVFPAAKHYLSPTFTILSAVSTSLNLGQFQCNMKA